MTFSTAILILANLVPLAGVFSLGWNAADILLLYWAENLVIGIYTVLKMALARSDMPSPAGAGPADLEHFLVDAPGTKDRGRTARYPKAFLMAVFCLHFAGFCGSHGFFLVMILGLGGTQETPFPSFDGPGPWPLVRMLFWAIGQIWQSRPDGLFLPLACLLLSHGFSFARNYLRGKEYLSITVSGLMFQPYKRIALLHLAIVIGASLVISRGLDSSVAVLSALVAAKIAMDVWLHSNEHSGIAGK